MSFFAWDSCVFHLSPSITMNTAPPFTEVHGLGGIFYGHSRCRKPRPPEQTPVYYSTPSTLGFAMLRTCSIDTFWTFIRLKPINHVVSSAYVIHKTW